MKQTQLKRRTPMRRTRRKALSPETRSAAWDFGTRARESACAMCGHQLHIVGHHILPLRVLKREVPEEAYYDLRNVLSLCTDPSPNACHERHEAHIARVPRAIVFRHAPEAFEFAEDWDLVNVFDREYPA